MYYINVSVLVFGCLVADTQSVDVLTVTVEG